MKTQTYLKIVIFFILFFLPLIHAQKAEIRIEHIGFGETMREAYFSIHNVGGIPITNITISVDGEVYKIVRGGYMPRKGFETRLYLDPGEHLIEVRSAEGAYDSLTIDVPNIPPQGITTTTIESKYFFDKNVTQINIGVLTVIFVVVAWFIIRRPRLDLSK